MFHVDPNKQSIDKGASPADPAESPLDDLAFEVLTDKTSPEINKMAVNRHLQADAADVLADDLAFEAYLQKVDFVTDKIAIGNYAQAERADVLSKAGFRGMLSVRCETSVLPPDSGVEIFERVPLIDGSGNDFASFERAVFTLKELVENHAPVFVHCHAGRSRSPAVVAAYLAMEHGLGADAALEFVAQKREINVSPDLVDLARRFAAIHGGPS